jgi:hypothetical protein
MKKLIPVILIFVFFGAGIFLGSRHVYKHFHNRGLVGMGNPVSPMVPLSTIIPGDTTIMPPPTPYKPQVVIIQPPSTSNVELFGGIISGVCGVICTVITVVFNKQKKEVVA